MREKKKKVERENVEFWQRGYQISCAQFCCPGVREVPEVKRKKKIDKLTVAMALPKMGGKKKKRFRNLWKSKKKKKKRCHVHNMFTTSSQ